MRFLDQIALRTVEKRLRQFMHSDERLIEYDVANVEPLGRNTAVILSNRAIYFAPKRGEVILVPYANVIDVQARGQQLIAIATSSGNRFVADITGPPKGDMYRTIAHYLEALQRHREMVDVPGGKVFAVCRPVKEGGALTWLLMPSEGVDLHDEDVRRRLRECLARPINRLGVDLP